MLVVVAIALGMAEAARLPTEPKMTPQQRFPRASGDTGQESDALAREPHGTEERSRRQSGGGGGDDDAFAHTVACVEDNCTTALVACSVDLSCSGALTSALGVALSGGNVSNATTALPASSLELLFSVISCSVANCRTAIPAGELFSQPLTLNTYSRKDHLTLAPLND